MNAAIMHFRLNVRRVLSGSEKGCTYFYYTGIMVVRGLDTKASSCRPRPPHITPFFWITHAPKKFLDPIPSSSRTDKVWGQGNGSGEVGGMDGMRERKESRE